MSIRKFLTSVADVYAYNSADTLLFTGKTLLDSSIEVSLGSAPVRGGRGNQLQYIYYHTGEMKITLTDAQWNLALLGSTVGSAVTPSNNVYTEESVSATVAGNDVTATVVGTPLAYGSLATLYGWAVTPDGNTIAGTFSGSNFTGVKLAADSLVTGQKLCIRYYALDAASTSITINANMIPSIVKLVLETQLNSADVTTNKIGVVQIIVPTATLSGAFTLSMKSDGVSNTPLSATALAYNGTPGSDACANQPYYARIIEIIDSSNWYDNVIGLSVVGGDFSMAQSTTATLNVWAIPQSGAAFKAPLGGELDFGLVGSPSATGTTVHATTGVVTSSTNAGTATINIHVNDVTTLDTTVIVTVSA
jgi:hypothetical protein